MTKKKPKYMQPSSRKLDEKLDSAETLIENKDYIPARELLTKLEKLYPEQPDVISMLAFVYQELGEFQHLQFSLEKLLRLKPNQPEAVMTLAQTYLRNGRIAHALQTVQRFLDRWPGHKLAGDARKMLAGLEDLLGKALEELEFPVEGAFELSLDHEKVQDMMSLGRYPQAIQLAEKILKRKPDFLAVRNNLTMLLWLEGRVDEAIAAAQAVLEYAPENIHALANLTRFLYLAERKAEATEMAERLKASQAQAADPWIKKIEALSYIGDDAGVLQLYEQYKKATSRVEKEFEHGGLYHFVAVAALRSGNQRLAKRCWHRALELTPGLRVAAENLEDLEQPLWERNGPWAFDHNEWLPPGRVTEIKRVIEKIAQLKSKEKAVSETQGLLVCRPDIEFAFTEMLKRGSMLSRDSVLAFCRVALTPDLSQALKDFAFGQAGTDQQRFTAGQILSEAGLLPDGRVRMWLRGEWGEQILMNYEITGEPEPSNLCAEAYELLEKGVEALREGRSQEGERLLKKALALEPDSPVLLNNLAAAYGLQKRYQEAEQLTREIFERFPDYFFGRVNMASIYVRQKKFDLAQEILEPLTAVRKLHITEFTGLARVQVNLALGRREFEAAESWLDMWEKIDEDSQNEIMVYRAQLVFFGRRK